MQIRASDDRHSQVRRWKDGHCSYGEGCKYAHGEAELRANIVAAQQFEGLPGPGASLTCRRARMLTTFVTSTSWISLSQQARCA